MKAISTLVGITVVFLFVRTTKTFPANENASVESDKKSSVFESEKGNSTSEESNPLKTPSISTTSSLLFKDTKPILTYLLGQPKKHGSVSSPAQLLSPDRYEFFTFDDDGQIVKKLMSVKEIQKIIANNEKGSVSGQGNPVEYYQILTVTPDVESIPSVSRINPNEPLFSIHDVIASVQNVLKSEIKQSSSKINTTNYLAVASSDHFDILTEKPETPYTVEAPKLSSTVSLQTNPSTILTTKTQESVTEITKSSAEKPDIHAVKEEPETKASLEILLPAATEGVIGSSKTPIQSATKDLNILAATTSTPEPVALYVSSQASTNSTTLSVTAGTITTKAPTLNTESVPLSLADAHPALSSNETFLEIKPTSLEQISRISEPVFEELKLISHTNNTNENLEGVETINKIEEKTQTEAKLNQSDSESSTFSIQVPFTPDLAESVSSVLWQIVSENSLLENSSLPTEPTTISSTLEKKVEKIETSESKHSIYSQYSLRTEAEPTFTTELPSQSKSTVRIEKLSENPLVILESILRPQNRPRPFQKIPTTEKQNLEEAESRTESFQSSSNALEEIHYSPSSTVTIITEAEQSPSSPLVPNQTTFKEESNQTSNIVSSTTSIPPTFIISLSPEAVDQSPEQLKPVTEKLTAQLVNTTDSGNSSQLTVEAVQVIQEGNIGNIPRTTEYPGQYVKDIQRMEPEEVEGSGESLTYFPSQTITTQLPFTEQESSTAEESIEEKAELSIQNIDEITNQTAAIVAEKIESKIIEKHDEQTEKFGITFVPMLIKTPSEFKQEEALSKIESQTEAKQEATTTNKSFESTEATDTTETTEEIRTTQTPQEIVESKELPESNSQDELVQVITSAIPKITSTENIIKGTGDIVVDDSVQDPEFTQIPTLKQNIQSKPFFGKPQKPPFIKPLKTKPQTDSKIQKPTSSVRPPAKEPGKDSEVKRPYENHLQSSPSVLELEATPEENLGLEATVVNLNDDVKRFAELCNELAFSLWSSVTHNGLSFVRSLVISPFAVTSLLAMVFLGARGPTSGQMNDILRLDDMVTFNPHLVFRNVTESLVISRNLGVATAAFVRELYSDKSKGKLLDFYKERAQQFYDGHVEEVNFKTIGDTLRRQTNHLVKRQTWGKITDFLRGSNLMPRAPLAAFSANIFQTDCTKASVKDRDGEMYFVILPASRLRRLVPIPAVVYRDGFLAGYEPNLDATVVAINPSNSAISTIFVLPGQQGLIAPGDTLARLEHHLLGSSYKNGHWSKLMRSLLPRPGLELQIPRLSHKSVINVTTSLQRMGLKDLFSADKADLTGLNGLANDLHLSDMLQVNLFSTCGEEPIGARHHSEIYPATPVLRREKSSENIFSESIENLFAISDFEDPAISALPLELRPRQARLPLSKPGARIPEPPRLRFDRPFLYFVRHNPTGLILHMGRFNPRLMP